ncbi:spore coat protein [Bacillus andreraoultii]|uniref:spore coat protein n=1 Tax=Bacillus andreraoultii TaxID=1499685 RepID=UPI00053A2551|nr:spore coat protein [Bacillus andreraoultii]
MNQESFHVNLEESHRSTSHHREWNALDPTSDHPLGRFLSNDDDQKSIQTVKEYQVSEELILVRDSADVTVNTTDAKAAISLVASLNAFIAAIINISVASADDAEEIKQTLFSSTGIKQVNVQKTVIENSRGVEVNTTDVNLAVNIQLLLQIILALLVNLEILS